MKALIAIYIVVAITVVTGTAWVNAEINKRVELPTSTNGSIMQASDQSGQILQPAGTVKPNFANTHNPQQTVDGNTLQGAGATIPTKVTINVEQ